MAAQDQQGQAPRRKLFKDPYAFPSRIGTFGLTVVNQGALAAGATRQFPDQDFNNSTDRPFFVERVKFFVGRVAGGGEVDADYNEVLVRVTGTLRDTKFSKNPAPLSVLCDRQRREWLLSPGQMIFGTQNGGATVEPSVQAGSLGAPFNLTACFLGYFEGYADITDSMIAPGAPKPG